jgi:hypothetical protein
MDMELSALLTRAREAGLDERTIDLAEQGDATAQCDLAYCYQGLHYRKAGGEWRQIRKKDPVEAVAWYRLAAEQGLAEAQYALGRCYHYHGEQPVYAMNSTFAKDPVQAVAWYRKAAEQGLAGAHRSRWRRGHRDDEYRADAEYELGRCYQDGRGVEKDPVQAVAWYRKAADNLSVNAKYELGVMYANGRGVRKNDAVAVRWYRKAKWYGHAKAEHNLKVMYADGRAVPEDEDDDDWDGS